MHVITRSTRLAEFWEKQESITSEVLSGSLNLTNEHISKLADFFHVSPAVFFEK